MLLLCEEAEAPQVQYFRAALVMQGRNLWGMYVASSWHCLGRGVVPHHVDVDAALDEINVDSHVVVVLHWCQDRCSTGVSISFPFAYLAFCCCSVAAAKIRYDCSTAVWTGRYRACWQQWQPFSWVPWLAPPNPLFPGVWHTPCVWQRWSWRQWQYLLWSWQRKWSSIFPSPWYSSFGCGKILVICQRRCYWQGSKTRHTLRCCPSVGRRGKLSWSTLFCFFIQSGGNFTSTKAHTCKVFQLWNSTTQLMINSQDLISWGFDTLIFEKEVICPLSAYFWDFWPSQGPRKTFQISWHFTFL